MQASARWLASPNLQFDIRSTNPKVKAPPFGGTVTLAPEAGLEPATIALTGRCSTIELLRINIQTYRYSTHQWNSGIFTIEHVNSIGKPTDCK